MVEKQPTTAIAEQSLPVDKKQQRERGYCSSDNQASSAIQMNVNPGAGGSECSADRNRPARTRNEYELVGTAMGAEVDRSWQRLTI